MISAELKKFLTENGLKEVTQKKRPGHFTALHLAVDQHKITLFKELIQALGVDPVDGQGQTPLFCAVQKGDIESAKALLELNAAMRHPHPAGATPLSLASADPESEMSKIFQKRREEILEAARDVRKPGDNTQFTLEEERLIGEYLLTFAPRIEVLASEDRIKIQQQEAAVQRALEDTKKLIADFKKRCEQKWHKFSVEDLVKIKVKAILANRLDLKKDGEKLDFYSEVSPYVFFSRERIEVIMVFAEVMQSSRKPEVPAEASVLLPAIALLVERRCHELSVAQDYLAIKEKFKKKRKDPYFEECRLLFLGFLEELHKDYKTFLSETNKCLQKCITPKLVLQFSKDINEILVKDDKIVDNSKGLREYKERVLKDFAEKKSSLKKEFLVKIQKSVDIKFHGYLIQFYDNRLETLEIALENAFKTHLVDREDLSLIDTEQSVIQLIGYYYYLVQILTKDDPKEMDLMIEFCGQKNPPTLASVEKMGELLQHGCSATKQPKAELTFEQVKAQERKMAKEQESERRMNEARKAADALKASEAAERKREEEIKDRQDNANYKIAVLASIRELPKGAYEFLCEILDTKLALPKKVEDAKPLLDLFGFNKEQAGIKYFSVTETSDGYQLRFAEKPFEMFDRPHGGKPINIAVFSHIRERFAALAVSLEEVQAARLASPKQELPQCAKTPSF